LSGKRTSRCSEKTPGQHNIGDRTPENRELRNEKKEKIYTKTQLKVQY
jgi:hypothetical protein